MNKKVNSHFIQKAFVKNWADENGDVNYIEVNERGTFNINDKNWKQPIVIRGFYSIEIEKGMNQIEHDGIQAIQSIISQLETSGEVAIKRNTLFALKFYYLLRDLRTNKHRENVRNLDGDELFNKSVTESGLSPKDFQELRIKVLIDIYSKYRIDYDWKVITEIRNEVRNKFDLSDPEKIMNETDPVFIQKAMLAEAMDSKFVFVSFESENLLLTEGGIFQEISKDLSNPNRVVYTLMPISPKYAIINYFTPYKTRGYLPKRYSTIFDSDILHTPNKVKYINPMKVINYGDKKEQVITHHKDDLYIYKLNKIKDNGAKAAVCNSMMLVHNLKAINICKNFEDFDIALELIDDMKIKRV